MLGKNSRDKQQGTSFVSYPCGISTGSLRFRNLHSAHFGGVFQIFQNKPLINILSIKRLLVVQAPNPVSLSSEERRMWVRLGRSGSLLVSPLMRKNPFTSSILLMNLCSRSRWRLKPVITSPEPRTLKSPRSSPRPQNPRLRTENTVACIAECFLFKKFVSFSNAMRSSELGQIVCSAERGFPVRWIADSVTSVHAFDVVLTAVQFRQPSSRGYFYQISLVTCLLLKGVFILSLSRQTNLCNVSATMHKTRRPLLVSQQSLTCGSYVFQNAGTGIGRVGRSAAGSPSTAATGNTRSTSAASRAAGSRSTFQVSAIVCNHARFETTCVCRECSVTLRRNNSLRISYSAIKYPWFSSSGTSPGPWQVVPKVWRALQSRYPSEMHLMQRRRSQICPMISFSLPGHVWSSVCDLHSWEHRSRRALRLCCDKADFLWRKWRQK